mmetsp:Transcript_124498/g.311316  ORF Transcript_124498/g.311316 Transcript_124498/m.311316 type:complete len:297 (-) Transcript_124498:138-1028(-)
MAPPRSMTAADAAHPAGPRRRGPIVVGFLAGCAALVGPSSLREAFMAPARGAIGQVPAAPMVAASAELRLEEARGDATPRTQMHGRYPDRSRKNLQGGPELPIRVNRKPVLAYSINDEENKEPGGSVLRRMWEMYDMNYEKMVAERQRYFRIKAQRQKWVNSFWMETGRKRKERRLRLEREQEWQQWMRTTGRKQGLSDPVVYNGPIIKMSKEEQDKMMSVDKGAGFLKSVAPKKPGKPVKGWKKTWGDMEDMKPGRWNHDGTAELMFKIWKRPLHKHPYDIGKKLTGVVRRGNVM